MRRKMLKALSLLLGTLVSGAAHAQDMEDVACEYGVPPMDLPPDPEPVPLYGIEEPVFLPEPAPVLVVSGVVKQAGSGLPLEGILVTLGSYDLRTATDGSFAFTLPAPGPKDVELVLEATDIDGRDHGGKHKPGKATVKVVSGALAPVVAEQGVLIELETR